MNHVILNECLFILKKFGAESQIDKAIEELDECRTELLFFQRHMENPGMRDEASCVDEISDALIMLIQMMHLFGYEKVLSRIHFKINRTKTIFMDRDIVRKGDPN